MQQYEPFSSRLAAWFLQCRPPAQQPGPDVKLASRIAIAGLPQFNLVLMMSTRCGGREPTQCGAGAGGGAQACCSGFFKKPHGAGQDQGLQVRRLREGHSARNVGLAICKPCRCRCIYKRTSQLHETRGNFDLKATCPVHWNRNDPSGRGISRLEKVTLKATAANAARIHDRGDTTAPVRSLPPPCTYEENFLIILAGAAGMCQKCVRLSLSFHSIRLLLPPLPSPPFVLVLTPDQVSNNPAGRGHQHALAVV